LTTILPILFQYWFTSHTKSLSLYIYENPSLKGYY
jgi:hypothetical protein